MNISELEARTERERQKQMIKRAASRPDLTEYQLEWLRDRVPFFRGMNAVTIEAKQNKDTTRKAR